MTYFIRPVDRELMPKGHDWLFIRDHDNGHMHLVVADDVPLELPRVALEAIIRKVCEHSSIPLTVAS